MRRLGALVAGLALYVQLALAGLGAPSPALVSAPIDALAGHALCLAGESGNVPRPADNAPVAPSHDHTLYCCLWHSLTGLAPHAAPAPLPVSYASISPVVPLSASHSPAPPHRPANARAPPILA